MSIQYKTIANLEISRAELIEWANSRETAEVVALAIHAIADSRSPDLVWAAPTDAEYDHILMAVRSYVENGLYDYEDGVFGWGSETININSEF